MSAPSQKFCASLARDAKFEQGLRGCFEYRDLGIYSPAVHETVANDGDES